MAPEWTRLCRAAGFAVEGEVIDVKLAEGRHQRVSVRELETSYELHSIVARAADLSEVDGVPLLAWRHNRTSQLVGFRVDQRGRLVGESWVPKVGLTAEEFQTYVRRVAAECDRFEYLLTGSDRE